MKFIDSHSHLYLEEFSDDLPQVIARARNAGVSHVLLPNIDSSTIPDMLRVCNLYKGYCFPMIGLHPTSVNSEFEKELFIIEEQLSSYDGYIAVGEVGLDLYWDKTFLKEQLIAFDRQIQFALKYNLPIVIHCRDAIDQLCDSLKPYRNTSLKGVFHSFAGTIPEAERLLEFTNFLMGINGVITFKNSCLAEVIKEIPLERIILETDAPYLTPVPYRGKRNESSFLKNTLDKIAETYRKTPEDIARETSQNTLKLFGKLS